MWWSRYVSPRYVCIHDSRYIKLGHEKEKNNPRRQTEPAGCAETAPPSYRSRRPPLCLLRSEEEKIEQERDPYARQEARFAAVHILKPCPKKFGFF